MIRSGEVDTLGLGLKCYELGGLYMTDDAASSAM